MRMIDFVQSMDKVALPEIMSKGQAAAGIGSK
jgi:hypothetical protein